MSRVFVLGAGFSKAIADLPLSIEMLPRIQNLVEADLKSSDPIRNEQARWVVDFINRTELRYVREPLYKKGIVEIVSSDFAEDFEFLLTLLDLNASRNREVLAKDDRGNIHAYTLGRTELVTHDQAGLFIEEYIYRVLWQNQVLWDPLTRFLERMRGDDTVITFNYDLLLDRAAYNAQLWHPAGGYGLDQFAVAPRWLNAPRGSSIKILKLHGSLNWDVSGSPIMLHWYHDSDTPYFPECVVAPDFFNLRHPPRRGFGILPSLLKRFECRPILNVWQQAHSALQTASEVHVIGYSLPEADAAAWTLFATAMTNRHQLSLYGIGGNEVGEIARRFRLASGCNVRSHNGGLEEFLSN